MKNMTFRRVKDSGTGSGDIYFSSSKSDSYRSMDLPSGSSDVYNYKSLAYSGGTLPRNFKKVTEELFFFKWLLWWLFGQLNPFSLTWDIKQVCINCTKMCYLLRHVASVLWNCNKNNLYEPFAMPPARAPCLEALN